MANGHKGYGSSRSSNETRIAPLEGRERAQALGDDRPDETRMAPMVELDVELDDARAPAASPAGESNRTMFATHAALFAERLQDKFAKKIYGRAPNRVLRIDEPEGPSTAGGRLARQSISLVPRKVQGPPIVCGWVDVAKSEAQLRGHESMTRRFEAQHGTPLDLSQEDYERCIDDLVEAMASGGIKVRVLVPEEASPVPVPSSPPEVRGSGIALWMLLTLATATFFVGLLVGRMGH